ncbi:15114_t:CDS:1 [Entrophospora sp. SA101]|nr:5753_t:CDS:1 [Entrophospora sp. SA101]CAJ0644918.1 15114_t:CDS:1 [Entrophospora sp. SA101]CAJ0834148.1 2628_t:CDS:1 [Entrophospora sp. SA101]CAJ0839393.1 1489_t:CDS:1 [Entrophospora sp. SA101]CAJ0846979.1 5173_t:CDS:1 [Entrophospora sp. SA101]
MSPMFLLPISIYILLLPTVDIETTNNDVGSHVESVDINNLKKELDSIIVSGNDVSRMTIDLNITDDVTRPNFQPHLNNFDFELESVPDIDDIYKSNLNIKDDVTRPNFQPHLNNFDFESESVPDTDDIYKSNLNIKDDVTGQNFQPHLNNFDFESESVPNTDDINESIIEDNVTSATTFQDTRGNIDMANIYSNNNELCNIENIKIETTIIKKCHHQILFCRSVNNIGTDNDQSTYSELCKVENIKIETIVINQVLFVQSVDGDSDGTNNDQSENNNSPDQSNDDDEIWSRKAIELEVRAGRNLDNDDEDWLKRKIEFEAELERLDYNLDNDLDNGGTTISIESPTSLDQSGENDWSETAAESEPEFKKTTYDNLDNGGTNLVSIPILNEHSTSLDQSGENDWWKITEESEPEFKKTTYDNLDNGVTNSVSIPILIEHSTNLDDDGWGSNEQNDKDDWLKIAAKFEAELKNASDNDPSSKNVKGHWGAKNKSNRFDGTKRNNNNNYRQDNHDRRNSFNRGRYNNNCSQDNDNRRGSSSSTKRNYYNNYSQDAKGENRQINFCSNCKQVGHLTRECTLRPRLNNWCKHCKSKEHNTRYCRNTNLRNNNNTNYTYF